VTLSISVELRPTLKWRLIACSAAWLPLPRRNVPLLSVTALDPSAVELLTARIPEFTVTPPENEPGELRMSVPDPPPLTGL
jgi:hypothetical protein